MSQMSVDLNKMPNLSPICSNKINIVKKKKNYLIKCIEGKDGQTNVLLVSAPKSSHFPLRKLPLTLHLPSATSHLPPKTTQDFGKT